MSRTPGTKNRTFSSPAAQDVRGAATSACKVNRRVGVAINSQVAWYENGRAIKWSEVAQSVGRAYDKWRVKMAERGIKVMDAFELQTASISQALSQRRAH